MRDRFFRLWRHGLIVWRLSWRERGMLVQAWLMLHGVALALRWTSFQRVYGFLGRGAAAIHPAAGDEIRLASNSVRHTYWIDKMMSRCSSVIG